MFEKSRAEGKAEGRAEGIIEGEAKGIEKRDMEIALAMYAQHKPGADYEPLIKAMKEFGISDETIEAAQKQHEAERV